MSKRKIFLIVSAIVLIILATGSWVYFQNQANIPSKVGVSGTSGVYGKVLIGPTCPVVIQGRDCADKPYTGKVSVKSGDGSKEVTSFTPDQDGNFRVNLPAGNYLLVPSDTSTSFPMGKSQSVTVESGKFIEIELRYDSGIR